MSGGGELRLLGRWGEARVAEDLRRRGHTLLASGFSCRFGEIDLISTVGEYLVFTEVKLRRNDLVAPGRAAVNGAKQRRLRLTAEYYLLSHPTRLQPRFDVAEVYAPQGTDTARPRIIYFENAF